MSEWQSIETAPSDGRQILVCGGRFRNAYTTEADGKWWRLRRDKGSTNMPTHWMPLPEPPEQDKEMTKQWLGYEETNQK